MGASGLLLVVLGAVTPGNMARFVDDPTMTARLPPWTGFVSTLGLFGWALAAGACLVGALALAGHDRERTRLFAATAALLALLFADDAFLIHDDLAPERAGVPENVVLALVSVVVAGWAWRFRRELARTDVRLLGLVAAAFGASMAIDVAELYELEVVEEWLKLSGILALAGWCVSAVVESLARLRT